MNGIMLKEMKTAQNETDFVQNEIILLKMRLICSK